MAAHAAAQEPAAPAAESLDVTITGEARDEVPIAKSSPPVTVPFEDVVSLSREGQRDQTLAEQVEYMTAAEYNKLLLLDARQAVSPLPVLIPRPPFFRMELPAGTTAQVWEFRVVNHNNQTVKQLEGAALPTKFLEWDGFDQGAFKIRAGPSYSPVLTVTDPDGRKRRYYGEAIQLDVLHYEQDGLLHVEFNNERLYERGAADFSREMEPFLQAALEIMRRRAGTPLRVIVYENPAANALAQKRLERWREFLLNHLLISTDDLTLATMSPKERGPVTVVMMLELPR